MASEWTDWADGTDLAGLSRAGDVVGGMGYDTDAVRSDPAQRSEVMAKAAGPYAALKDEGAAQRQSTMMAQNDTPPRPQAGDQRFAVPDGEPPNPTLKTRGQAAAAQVAPAAPSQPLPDTLSPQPSAQTAPAYSPDGSRGPQPASPDWQGYTQKGVQGVLGIADKNSAAYSGLPDAPDTTNLDTRIETESIPTNPREKDPITGKPLYKPGFGTRVVRGIEAFGAGGVPAVLDPARAGATPYGAPTKEYGEDEDLRRAQLANDQQKKADVLARFKAKSDVIEARAKGLQTVAPDYKDAGTMSSDAQNAQTNTAKEGRDAMQATPQYKTSVSQAEFDQRGREADRIGLKGTTRALYLANGKLPDPKQASAEETSRAQALRTFRAQNHRDPQNLDEINQVNAAAAGKLKEQGGDTPSEEVQAAARSALADITDYTSGWARQPDGSYRTTKPHKFDMVEGPVFDAEVNKRREKANVSLTKKGWQIDGTGQLVKAGGGGGGPQPAPDGTRRRGPNGIEIKKNGAWVPEGK